MNFTDRTFSIQGSKKFNTPDRHWRRVRFLKTVEIFPSFIFSVLKFCALDTGLKLKMRPKYQKNCACDRKIQGMFSPKRAWLIVSSFERAIQSDYSYITFNVILVLLTNSFSPLWTLSRTLHYLSFFGLWILLIKAGFINFDCTCSDSCFYK